MNPEVTKSGPSLGDVDDLRAFCAVVDLGSLTAAGRLLGEPKATVSRRIARLERQTTLELFKRHPRAITVTERGRALRRELAPALEILDQALLSVRQPGLSSILRVTAPPDIGGTVIAPMLAALMAEAPAMRVQLTLTERVLSFDAHGIDVAFRVARQLRESALIGRRIATLEAGLFASPTYLTRYPAPRLLGDLPSHRLLLIPGQESRLRLVDRRQPTKVVSLGVQPTAIGDPSTLVTLAVAGAGVALLPTLAVRHHVAVGQLVPVLAMVRMRETTSLFMVHRRGRIGPSYSTEVDILRDFAARWLATGKRASA